MKGVKSLASMNATDGDTGQCEGALRGRRVLVVDDNRYVFELLKAMLTAESCDVTHSVDGCEALEVLRTRPADLVITDVRMPRMDGLELTREIKAHFPAVPVVLMTGFADLKVAQQAVELGVAGLLKKPFDELPQVLRILERAIQSGTGPAGGAVDGDADQPEKERDLLHSFGFAYNDLRELQVQLLQRQKLESLGRLSAGIAHELNNPLAFIMSNLNTLSEYSADIARLTEAYKRLMDWALESGDSDGRRLAAAAAAIHREVEFGFLMEDLASLVTESLDGANRVRTVIADLKTYAHPGEGEMNYHNLNEIIERTLNIAANEIRYKAEIVKDLGELPEVMCLANQLGQVFLNLLVNAAQAIEKDGVIRIRTWAADGDAHCTISDNGCGMTPEVQAHIFDPFYTTKKVGEGTGLGLSIVQSIVRRHGGHIDVESAVGEGTVFTVIIPASTVGNDGEDS